MELLRGDQDSKVVTTDGKSEQDLHPGCVKRVLSVRDRLLIFQALNTEVGQGGSAKTLARLMSIRELLDQDGVDDYIDIINKTHAKALQGWADALNLFIKDGKVDPGPKPKQTNDQILGPENVYWVKALLDTHISTVLKDAKFDAANAKYVLALFEKYGIKIEE